ncbi:hypothetical protein PFISCL1PPCAC_12122, partial [Pristionchus fissidentatus]
LLQVNKISKNGESKVGVDKTFTIAGQPYAIDKGIGSDDPRTPMRIHKIGFGREVQEMKVHYPADRPWISMLANSLSVAIEFNGHAYLWEYDDPSYYEDEDREGAGYLQRAVLESDGIHWSPVQTTGRMPEEIAYFSVYDSMECRFYMVGIEDNLLYSMDMKSMHWERIETAFDQGVGDFGNIDFSMVDVVVSARKLHLFMGEHIVLDIDTKRWSLLKHSPFDQYTLRTAY